MPWSYLGIRWGEGREPYGRCHKRSSEDVWELREARQTDKGLGRRSQALSEKMRGAAVEEGFPFMGEGPMGELGL